MSVRREGNGKRPWRVRFYDEGGLERQRSFPTKALAEEFERSQADRKARVRAGLPVEQGPISYDDLCELFLDGYTSSSKPWVAQMLGYSRSRFGSVQVRLLRPDQIARWLHSELDVSPKTKKHILGRMRQVCAAGVEWGYLHQSPVRPGAVKAPPQAAPQVFPLESWAEVARVAEAAGRWGPLIRFACATGLRPQEWSRLEWADVDLKGRVMNVEGSKTAAARRAVVLSRPALWALDETPRRLDSPLVFPAPRGGRLDTRAWAQKVWRPALAAAGLRDRPSYQMRHTFATLALAQGCTLEWIGGQMGHSSWETTRRHYARFVKRVDDRMRALLDEMEADHESRRTHEG